MYFVVKPNLSPPSLPPDERHGFTEFLFLKKHFDSESGAFPFGEELKGFVDPEKGKAKEWIGEVEAEKLPQTRWQVAFQ